MPSPPDSHPYLAHAEEHEEESREVGAKAGVPNDYHELTPTKGRSELVGGEAGSGQISKKYRAETFRSSVLGRNACIVLC